MREAGAARLGATVISSFRLGVCKRPACSALQAQEERRQQQRALASLPRAKQQQQLEPAEAVAGAMVHVTVASGSKQPKQQQQHSRAASPSIPGGLKRSSSQATVQDAKRHRGDAVPELISPNGSKYRSGQGLWLLAASTLLMAV